MDKKRSKIAIIGAGSVGASVAFSIAMKNLVSELVIIDVNKEKAEGEALDISHGLSALGEMDVYSGDYCDVKDANIIIVAAGVGRKPGETRLDLAKKNVSIIKDITKNIMEHYNGGVIMAVSNPVDVVTYVIQKESKLPKGMVFGTGAALDSARFRWLLAKKLNVNVKNVHGFIAGEHGDSQFAVWSGVNVGGMPLDDYCKEHNIEIDKDQLEHEVIYSGAEVIKRKGATYYAIASVVVRISEFILKDQQAISHTSNILEGEYGISDLCLSLPNIMGINGIEKDIKFHFTDEEIAKLHKSAAAIRAILDNVEI